ncbi:dCTP deaminase [Blastomonas natatoria]|uniref:dCTP deaminase n=1 Tax=Blastomonas natatoria TaxID=34015 RepID=A0A2V3V3U3_9SPHN|nr:hypothetical protein [Blastomonas natatoria]PXW76462.1 dCTP deaminase [Blastomonas natatoria]
MTFWSGQRLSTDGVTQQIVDPFQQDRIDCSAYTLTLGAEAYVTPHFGDNLREGGKQQLAKPELVDIRGVQRTQGGGQVVIPPGQFAFLLTEETVSIPPDAMGFISLKSKPKFGGLINVSGFHVDPGFKGKLIFSVFNAGPTALHFARGEHLFLLWIADLSFKGVKADGRKQHIKTSVGYAEIPNDLVNQIKRENHSLQSLSLRVEKLTTQVNIATAVATALATILGIFAAYAALWPGVKTDKYEVRIEQPIPAIAVPQHTPSSDAQPKLRTNPPKPSGN